MNTVTSNTGFILRHGSFADGVNVEICILFRGGIQIKILMRCHLVRNQNEHFTARKRSLGQGNVFKPVCHSLHGGGGLPDRDPLDRDRMDRDPPGQRPLGQRPLGQRTPWTENPLDRDPSDRDPPRQRTPCGKERVVRILLKCIPVIFIIIPYK